MESFFAFWQRILCIVQRILPGLIWPSRYSAPDWRYDPTFKRWILTTSEGANGKAYTCAEFVRAWIQSPATGPFNNFEPKWGPGSNELETGGVVAWLGTQGYTTGSCRCGCCPGETRNCVVVYTFPGGMVDHVAIFDPVNCDWIAKRSGVLTENFIERYMDPMGYVRTFPTGVTPSGPTYYCKPGVPPPRRDLWLMHQVARYAP